MAGPHLSGTLAKIWELAEPVARDRGLELADIEFLKNRGGAIVRVYLDNPDGLISLDDCAAVSKELSPLLDVHEVVPGRYSLEVSSPGEERPLRKPEDFTRFAGEVARFQLTAPPQYADGARMAGRTVTGAIVGCNGETVTLALEREDEVDIPLSTIRRAHLVVTH